MAIVRCSKGHYYDNAKFSQCPHCGIFAGDNDEKTVAMPMEPAAHAASAPAFSGVHSAAAMDDDKTVAMSQSAAGAVAGNSYSVDEDDKTISLYAEEKGTDFITGWIVCVEGPERGRDYKLHQGFNRLGRDYRMDIAVMEDQSISREAAFAIVYDDRSNRFFAVQQPGGNAYLNGTALMGAVELKSRDILRTGNSEFEFIAFCREGRTWN